MLMMLRGMMEKILMRKNIPKKITARYWRTRLGLLNVKQGGWQRLWRHVSRVECHRVASSSY